MLPSSATMATEKQIAANRNAQKSTGPKTAEGKQRSSQNATTHGLTSTDTVLPWESQEDLDAILQAFINEHQPESPTERVLVERLAQAWFKTLRARHLEREGLRLCTEAVTDRLKNITPKGTVSDKNKMAGALALAVGLDTDNTAKMIHNLNRYQGVIDREFHRVLDNLLAYKREKRAAERHQQHTKLASIVDRSPAEYAEKPKVMHANGFVLPRPKQVALRRLPSIFSPASKITVSSGKSAALSS